MQKLSAQINFEMKQQEDKETKLCMGSIQKHFAVIESSYKQIVEQLLQTAKEFQVKMNLQIKKQQQHEKQKKKNAKKSEKRKIKKQQ